MRPCAAFAALLACFAGTASIARAQTVARNVTFRFVPTTRAQIAAWIESADGARFATVGLTSAVALRGIGNRPGASQMNSGYHWPYGRREGVLPVWAHRRADAGGLPFPRIIFQRRPEGYASRTCEDSTRDSYYCLSFTIETTRRDALDAISCASVFNSDKGRILTAADIANGYGEPFVDGGSGGGAESLRALDGSSLYPPRRDFVSCADASTVNVCMGGSSACQDHRDSALYRDQARAAMPEIDAVTMATPPGDQPTAITFDVPAAWPDGDYVAYLEINTEGDYNGIYNDAIYPTPTSSNWDTWAISYGYPYRGQPSVVFRLAISIRNAQQTWPTDVAYGYGSLSGVGPQGGAITPIDATISNSIGSAPGSGVDRLRIAAEGYRLRVDIGTPPEDAGVPPDAGPDAAATDDAGDAPPAEDAGSGDSGHPTTPLCIPGMTVACACVGGGQGAQTCGSDGNHFEVCQCPSPAQSVRKEGCDCSCDVGGGAGGPLGIALLALALVARRRRPS